MGQTEISIKPSIHTIAKLTEIANDLIGYDNIHTVFEFGSRYGEDSIAFALKYPKATVYAFECNTNTLPACRENISRYKNIVFTEKAVSDIDGPISFFKIDKDKTETSWPDGNQGASSLLKASGKYPIENYVQEEIKVESVTLSTFMHTNKLNSIDILWMDIQGAELLALQGLHEDVEKVKIIHLEVEFFEIYKDQPLFNEITKFLDGNNFDLIGFSSKNEFSGDAIFINRKFVSAKESLKYKKLLEPGPDKFYRKLYNKIRRYIAG
jgi:FkbM family methyltransferase